MKSLIQKLISTPSPSGYEGQIRAVIRAEVKDYADDLQVDALGNLIVRKGSGGVKFMLAAHMDEIGIIVTHVDENGFVRFTNIGGVIPRYCPTGRVRFLDGTLGVIGTENIKDAYSVPPLDKMFIDVGATSKKDCPVKVGDVAVFERPFSALGHRLVSKAMDDRISVAVMIEALRQIKSSPFELYFVFTAQEEVGVRGATTAAYAIDPDIGLAIDVTRTGDTPKSITMAVSLGKGPAIKVKDAGMIVDPRIVDWMVKTAEKAGLPYQMEVLEHGGTDARSIQLTRAGVPAGCLSIPCRYIHSPSEMVDINDIHNAVKLLVELISNPATLGS
ncbi:MAG: M42 family metallopeptidase [Anaerolineales bacterium]|nr:M42 family metallopeptidase [Anaerolineales bacterium]